MPWICARDAEACQPLLGQHDGRHGLATTVTSEAIAQPRNEEAEAKRSPQQPDARRHTSN